MRNNTGKQFEREVAQELDCLAMTDPAFYYFQIPDGLKPLYSKKSHQVVSMIPVKKTPADFAFSHYGQMGLIEAKTTAQPRLPIGKNGLKPHQLETLTTLWQEPKRIKTFLLWRYLNTETGGVVLIPGNELLEIVNHLGTRKSIPWKSFLCFSCGSILSWSFYKTFTQRLQKF